MITAHCKLYSIVFIILFSIIYLSACEQIPRMEDLEQRAKTEISSTTGASSYQKSRPSTQSQTKTTTSTIPPECIVSTPGRSIPGAYKSCDKIKTYNEVEKERASIKGFSGPYARGVLSDLKGNNGNLALFFRLAKLPEAFIGKTFLFFPLDPKEVSKGFFKYNSKYPAENWRNKLYSNAEWNVIGAISFSESHVSITGPDFDEQLPYIEKHGVICFSSKLINEEFCLVPALSKSSQFSDTILTYVTNYGGKISPRGIGYLKLGTINEARIKFREAREKQAKLNAENKRMIDQGGPKLHLDTSGYNAKLQDYISNIYYGSAKPSVMAYEFYMTYHGNFSAKCMPNYNGPSEKFEVTGVKYKDTIYEFNKTVTVYEKYVKRIDSVRSEYAGHYHYLRSRWLDIWKNVWLGDYGSPDMSLVSFMQVIEKRYAEKAEAMSKFIDTEGCFTPTTKKFEKNLLELAKNDSWESNRR